LQLLVLIVDECSLGIGQGIDRMIQEKTQVLGEKPVPQQFCPPQNPHGLPWDCSQAFMGRGW
jgi:hypothetical protein